MGYGSMLPRRLTEGGLLLLVLTASARVPSVAAGTARTGPGDARSAPSPWLRLAPPAIPSVPLPTARRNDVLQVADLATKDGGRDEAAPTAAWEGAVPAVRRRSTASPKSETGVTREGPGVKGALGSWAIVEPRRHLVESGEGGGAPPRPTPPPRSPRPTPPPRTPRPTKAPRTPRPTPPPRTPRPTKYPRSARSPRPTRAPTPAPLVSKWEATPGPTSKPTPDPTEGPTLRPTIEPSAAPMRELTAAPTLEPTSRPTEKPTPRSTEDPTPGPTPEPTLRPTEKPTPRSTEDPTPEPTPEPTPRPTKKPTPRPSEKPTLRPTKKPTPRPSHDPTPRPTKKSTRKPTPRPTKKPATAPPTLSPTPSYSSHRASEIFLKLGPGLPFRMDKGEASAFEDTAREFLQRSFDDESASAATLDGEGNTIVITEVDVASHLVIKEGGGGSGVSATYGDGNGDDSSSSSTYSLVVELEVRGEIRPYQSPPLPPSSFAARVRGAFDRDFGKFVSALVEADPEFFGELSKGEEEGVDTNEEEDVGDANDTDANGTDTDGTPDANGTDTNDTGTDTSDADTAVFLRDEFFVKLRGLDRPMTETDEAVFEAVAAAFIAARPGGVALNVTKVSVTAQSLTVPYGGGGGGRDRRRRVSSSLRVVSERREEEIGDAEGVDKMEPDGGTTGSKSVNALFVQFEVVAAILPTANVTLADFVRTVLDAVGGENFAVFVAALAGELEYFAAALAAVVDDKDTLSPTENPTESPSKRPSTPNPSPRPSPPLSIISYSSPTDSPTEASTSLKTSSAARSSADSSALKISGITLLSLAGIAVVAFAALLVARRRRSLSRGRDREGGRREAAKVAQPPAGKGEQGKHLEGMHVEFSDHSGHSISGLGGHAIDSVPSGDTHQVDSEPSTPRRRHVVDGFSEPGTPTLSTPSLSPNRPFVAESLNHVLASNAHALSAIDFPALAERHGRVGGNSGSVSSSSLQDTSVTQLSAFSTPERNLLPARRLDDDNGGDNGGDDQDYDSSSRGGGASLELLAEHLFDDGASSSAGSERSDNHQDKERDGAAAVAVAVAPPTAATIVTDIDDDESRDILSEFSKSFEEGISFTAYESDDDFEAAVALASARIDSARLGGAKKAAGGQKSKRDHPPPGDSLAHPPKKVRLRGSEAAASSERAHNSSDAQDRAAGAHGFELGAATGDYDDDASSASTEAVVKGSDGDPSSETGDNNHLFRSLATAVVACRGTSSAYPIVEEK